MRIKRILLVMSLVTLVGCGEYAAQKYDTELWRAYFSECMKLAALNSRTGDDDVSNIVVACKGVSRTFATIDG